VLEVFWKKVLIDLLRIDPKNRLNMNKLKNDIEELTEHLGLSNVFSLRKALTENINTNYLQSKMKIGQQSVTRNIGSAMENTKPTPKYVRPKERIQNRRLRKNKLFDQNYLRKGFEQNTLSMNENTPFSNNSDSFLKEFPQFDNYDDNRKKPTMKLNLKVVELSGVGFVNKL
jgi:hypothetical protein